MNVLQGKLLQTAQGLPSGPDLAAKVRFLRKPESYPHRPTGVEVRQTHTSFIFLADRFVYKLKKPLRYDFLDFSTEQARRRNCQEEVRLNRRFAANVYLGTKTLTLEAGDALALGGDGAPVDWLVEMRRLPDERVFETRLNERRLDTTDIVRIAALLCRFYESAPPVAMTSSSYLERFESDIEANRRELCEPAYGLSKNETDAITAAQLGFIRRREALFAPRVESGWVVEGHGDLRPEHIYVGRDPVIIDCLEFNRDFRILDPLDELGFLAMECERLGAPFVGHVLFSEYERVTSDHVEDALVHFYMSYRALLWAKLAIRHMDRLEGRFHEKWIAKANAYLRLAEDHIRRA